jgi:hypothetical protein
MREGDRYPELRNMNVDRTTLQERIEPMPDWSLDRDQMMERWRSATVRVREIEGVRITMPRDDFEALMSIYQAHYHACSRNPAVAEAWHQYKMLAALTA